MGGSIATDTVWAAELVRVIGDVMVEDGVTLTIPPETEVQFEDNYRLTVQGTLIAVGTPSRRITFTSDEPERFKADRSLTGCWNGIRFHGTSSTNSASRIEYCRFQYSKAVDATLEDYECGGGAISMIGFSKVTIAGCIFTSNIAEFGGAIYLYNASPLIVNNLFTDNHVLVNAAAIYCGYAYPRLLNNTIVNNAVHNQDYPYETTSAVLCYLSKPVLTNNIIRHNQPDQPYLHYQILENKPYYTRFNNIEGIDTSESNIDGDPMFHTGPDGGFYLSQRSAGQPADSPCLDAGDGLAGESGIGLATTRTDQVNDTGQADMGYHHGWKSAAAAMTCQPATGTLPFQTMVRVMMANRFAGGPRRLAARVSVVLADGQTYHNWRTGYSNLGPESALARSWSQTFPALGSLSGINHITLAVQDVTPAPYNQPPHPGAGDTDTASCEVIGVLP